MKSIKITKTDIVLFYIREYIKLTILMFMKTFLWLWVFAIVVDMLALVLLFGYNYYIQDIANTKDIIIISLVCLIILFSMISILSTCAKIMEKRIKL